MLQNETKTLDDVVVFGKTFGPTWKGLMLRDVFNTIEKVTAASSDNLSLESLASTGCRASSMSDSIHSNLF